MIRQPDFVTEEVYREAREALRNKKPELDLSTTALVTLDEGLCAQIMHVGPYDTEPESIGALNDFVAAQGYVTDIQEPSGVMAAADVENMLGSCRLHHEIYLGDPRKTKPENLRTVVRHPVRVREEA